MRGFSSVLACAMVLLACASAGPVAAQSTGYPTQRVVLMVGFAPGGTVDIAARLLGQELSTRWGVPVVVENRPGADSNLASRAVATAAPDGYTLLVASTGLVINQSLYKRLDYSIRQLTPIAFPALGDGVAVAVNAKNPAQTLRALLETNGSKAFTVGAGGAYARIAGEYLLRVRARADTIHVPFQGGAPALNALVGGHIDVLSAPIPEALPQVRQGTVRVLGVTGTRRSASLPDVPTFGELGYDGLEVGGLTALFAPAGTPDAVLDQINEAANAVVQTPHVRERLRSLGYEANPMARSATGDYLARQLDTWTRMVKETGISVD